MIRATHEYDGHVNRSTDQRNRLTSWLEVQRFTHNPPEKYFLYICQDRNTAETWMGDKLGTLQHIGREYRDNFGSARVSIVIRGINGKRYHGTWFADYDYARVRAYK